MRWRRRLPFGNPLQLGRTAQRIGPVSNIDDKGGCSDHKAAEESRSAFRHFAGAERSLNPDVSLPELFLPVGPWTQHWEHGRAEFFVARPGLMRNRAKTRRQWQTRRRIFGRRKFDTSFKCFVKISSNEEWLSFFSSHKANYGRN